ncbi:Dihydroxyacetone kinase, L subunit [Crenothrix polyspora]|uniref:Dihydroxyacetone kinase, L subunit n=1 Tax=Crenothrix polyspora TaxID=360316 RepID=A0A1R4HIT8_9GAMM|nr:dihydroxyacetone kinase subunit DhaL [Crenothrix polyspora]SJM96109.1 Dihydroxyacetone kinase, L subunit [Crenothrix polyspora]
MSFTPSLLPKLIETVTETIIKNAGEITALDQAIGDGDHVTNLQRGLTALMAQRSEISQLDWPAAWQKIGMTVMTSVGGASGSLYGTLFVAMSKSAAGKDLNVQSVAEAFAQAVEAVKHRGKSDVGEKTMLDVLVPVAKHLQDAAAVSLPLSALLEQTKQVAITGMESTRDMLATKGRASFLGERTRGHIDAGAMSSQLVICALVDVLLANLTAPAQ